MSSLVKEPSLLPGLYSRKLEPGETNLVHISRGFASAPNSPRPFFGLAQRALNQQVAGNVSKTDVEPIDELAARLCAMFPTAREYEVKKLLKRYHYREAVVVSALQVQKHPVTMKGPGPHASPSQARHYGRAWLESPENKESQFGGPKSIITPNSPLPRPGSSAETSYTIGSPRTWDKLRGTCLVSPKLKPPSSPKIKLRYLKSVFPKAEETFLLDLLSNSDNNVQTATQTLLTLGHEKRDFPLPLTPKRSILDKVDTITLASSVHPTTPPPRRSKTLDEKLEAKRVLVEQFQDVVEQVIELALESTDYDEVKAGHVLTNAKKVAVYSNKNYDITDTKKSNLMKYSQSGLFRGFTPCVEKKLIYDDLKRMKPKHTVFPLRLVAKGANDGFLSESYVLTQGSSVNYTYQDRAKGPMVSLLAKRAQAKGPNLSLISGSSKLAKGSMGTTYFR